MGALCGKESSPHPFSKPGRTLSSAPPAQTTSSVPAQRKVGGPPRTLGGSSSSNPPSGDNKPASKAGEAALKRIEGKAKGQMGQQLDAQKKQSINEVRKGISDENRARKEIDQNRKDIYSN